MPRWILDVRYLRHFPFGCSFPMFDQRNELRLSEYYRHRFASFTQIFEPQSARRSQILPDILSPTSAHSAVMVSIAAEGRAMVYWRWSLKLCSTA